MDYTNYSVIDFVMDEHFQQWVLHPEKDTDFFWYQWLKDHPEKHHDIHEARKLVLLNKFNQTPVPATRLAEMKENIKKNVDFQRRGYVPKKLHKHGDTLFWFKVAATVLLLLVAGIAFFTLKDHHHETIATGYGQIKEIVLPDSSKVFLNANSLIEYSPNWTEKNDREIWLRGEAFFEVARKAISHNHTQDTSFTKFIVHVDGLDVEVVGTEFNVNNRNGAVKVVLNEGKVRVKARDGKQMNMEPGEMLTYSVQSKDLLKKLVDPAKHISWRNYHLIFDGQQLQEIASILETNYGVQVVFSDPTLSEKKITGILPSDNLDVILEALQTIYGIRIKKEGNNILFQN